MKKYLSLTLGVMNFACIVVNIINQKWDILVINIIVGFADWELGKTVFLTCEAAEKKLEELKNEI